MLMWHILLLPLVLGAFVVIHILMVRRQAGVVPPFDIVPTQDVVMTGEGPPTETVGAGAGQRETTRDDDESPTSERPGGSRGGEKRFSPIRPDVHEWHGAYRPYDLIKEVTVAFVVVSILVVVLAVIFSSPDEAPVTVKSWSARDPVDFAQTAITELDGTSGTATYGPPYNHTAGASQSIGPISPEKWAGVHSRSTRQ